MLEPPPQIPAPWPADVARAHVNSLLVQSKANTQPAAPAAVSPIVPAPKKTVFAPPIVASSRLDRCLRTTLFHVCPLPVPSRGTGAQAREPSLRFSTCICQYPVAESPAGSVQAT